MSIRRRAVKQRIEREEQHQRVMSEWRKSLVERVEHTLSQIPEMKKRAPASDHEAITECEAKMMRLAYELRHDIDERQSDE